MNDEEKGAVHFPNLKSLYEALPAEAKGVIAFLLMYLFFFAATMYLGPLVLENNCWVLEAKEHRFFKINSCNGDVIEITEEYRRKGKSLSKESD